MNYEQPAADNMVDANKICDSINANVNANLNGNGNDNSDCIGSYDPVLKEEPQTGTTVQPKKTSNTAMPWLFGKHEISAVVSISLFVDSAVNIDGKKMCCEP